MLKIILILLIFASAASATVEIGGYYENDIVGVVKRGGGGLLGNLNTLRLRFEADLPANVKLHLEPEYDLLLRTGDFQVAGLSGIDQLVWDRAYFKLFFPCVDVTLGQQKIAWGTGYIWNPTDVLNPFTLSFAVKEEDEQDVLAVRFEVPLGELSGFDAFALTNNTWEQTTKGFRAKTNFEDHDVSISYVDLGAQGFQLGFDAAGEIFGLGVREEIALVSPRTSNRYYKFVLGGNYTFENGWYVDLEYFFNGAGNKKKENYDWTNYLAGNINQLGMDYLYLGSSKNLDEITTLKLSLLYNLDDLSHIIYPSFTRNVHQNVDVSLEAMITEGEAGSEYHPTDTQDPSRLIGSNIVFVRTKYSF